MSVDRDGAHYRTTGEKQGQRVCGPGEFRFAATRIDHGHIFGMCQGLIAAGGELVAVWEPDAARRARFVEIFPQAEVARCEEELWQRKDVQLVASSAITSQRCQVGLLAHQHGKHFFSDKAPFTDFDSLEAARESCCRTGLKWAVYYSERIAVECAVLVGQLIKAGEIGQVIQVINLAPHNLAAATRPAWFFQRQYYGGIICDIGCHQIDQFLSYSGASDARVNFARVANVAHPQYPELQDFGEASLVSDNGCSHYLRLDWLNPSASRTWGDGRAFILGTEGYIELRKYVNVGVVGAGSLKGQTDGEHLFIVNHQRERYINAKGKVGLPYFGELIRDCLDGSEQAMSQSHVFKVAELALECQRRAEEQWQPAPAREDVNT